MATKTKSKTKAKRSPSPRSVASKKQAKSLRDDRVFNIALAIVGVLFIGGLLYAMFGTGAVTNTRSGEHAGAIQTDINSGQFADVLRQADANSPVYDQAKPHSIMVYIGGSWGTLSREAKTARVNQIGQAWQQLVTKHFGSQTDTEVMVHTPQDQMIGTWYPSEGGKVQQ